MLRDGGFDAAFHYSNVNGDIYEDTRELEFSKFVNSIAGPLSALRNMAGVLNRLYIQDAVSFCRMLTCLEEVCQFIIASNMNAYWVSIAIPGGLSSHWNLYERVVESSESDLSAPTPGAVRR